MQAMAAKKKSLPAVIGGLALVLIGGYFGIDLTQGSSAPEQSQHHPAHQDSPGAKKQGENKPDGNKQSGGKEASASGFATCSVDTLPKEALDTVDDILAGGPFEHPEDDDKRFGNYERVLPEKNRNYYREYTVDTPGLRHRGERRIVTGGGKQGDPDQWYYTDDHYESFCVIPDAEK